MNATLLSIHLCWLGCWVGVFGLITVQAHVCPRYCAKPVRQCEGCTHPCCVCVSAAECRAVLHLRRKGARKLRKRNWNSMLTALTTERESTFH